MLVMFDIDGTLVESYEFDSECFQAAVKDVLNITISDDWGRYRHVTDSGILKEVFDTEEVASSRRPQLVTAIKSRFITRIARHLEGHSCRALPGAAAFMAALNQCPDKVIAMATGGWRESALLKLQAAGLSPNGIAMATASDCESILWRWAMGSTGNGGSGLSFCVGRQSDRIHARYSSF